MRARSSASASGLETGNGRVVNCRYADNYAAAQGAAEARLADYSRERVHLEVALPLLDRKNARAAIEAGLSDVVAVQAETQGVTGAWLLEGMEINVDGVNREARWWLTGV